MPILKTIPTQPCRTIFYPKSLKVSTARFSTPRGNPNGMRREEEEEKDRKAISLGEREPRSVAFPRDFGYKLRAIYFTTANSQPVGGRNPSGTRPISK